MSQMHATVDVEIADLSRRPSELEAPEVLSALAVQTVPLVELYARRFRDVLTAGLSIGKTTGFDSEALPVDDLPGWFSGRVTPIPDEVVCGREGFTSQRESEPFDAQEWLEMLNPDYRQWRWWDITAGGPGTAIIWIDAGGEVVFNCEELHWLLYSCGARAAVGPLLLPSAVWKGQESMGIGKDE